MSAPSGSDFERGKLRALNALFRALECGTVDPDIVPLLSVLNGLDGYYTTSSCSGRIQLAATRLPGEKFAMLVVAKWHRRVALEEVKEVLERCHHEDLWISAQGPILHVACRDLGAALRLLEIAHRVGLKHSGVLWVGKRVVAEIVGPDKVEVPLRLCGKPMLREESLALLVDRLNEVLERSKARLRRLEAALRGLPVTLKAAGNSVSL